MAMFSVNLYFKALAGKVTFPQGCLYVFGEIGIYQLQGEGID